MSFRRKIHGILLEFREILKNFEKLNEINEFFADIFQEESEKENVSGRKGQIAYKCNNGAGASEFHFLEVKNLETNLFLRDFVEKMPNFWTRSLRIVDRNVFTHRKVFLAAAADAAGDRGRKPQLYFDKMQAP